MEELRKQFNRDMEQLCVEIKEASHNPSRFIDMLTNGDPVDVAKRLVINKPTSTFEKLASIKKLYLTVEYYVIMPKYQPLFDESVIQTSRKRLDDYKWD